MRLHVLGPAELRDVSGRLDHSFLTGPKRLALLVYLALSAPGTFRRRDHVLPLFWPDRGQKSARNALSNMLYHVRGALGRDAVVGRGTEELSVNAAAVWCDALAFREALDEGRLQEALALYRGPLLEGLHVPGASPAFDQWLERERERLQRDYLRALGELAGAAEERGDWGPAAEWWRRLSEEDPYDSSVAGRLVGALSAAGRHAAALQRARDHGLLLEAEFGADREEEVRKLTEGLRIGDWPAPTAGRNGRPVPLGPPAPPPAPTATPTHRALAVLPFETLGGGRATELTDGLHGDLITRLSAVSDLTVISRTSVRRYRATAKSVPEIGAELGARWVLEGEVQEAGDQVQVNVRLVDAREDRQVWARDYRRGLAAGPLFEVQGAVAREIARSLEVEITSEEGGRVDRRPTESLEAYRLCVQGRVHLDERTETGMRRALGYFRRAVGHDGDFVLALVGRCDALVLLYDYGYEVPDRVLPEAEGAVRRALELDPDSAEAHASLGGLLGVRREGPAAIRALRRAVDLRPSYAEAHNWLSWLGNLLGDRPGALESARRAVELNPLSAEAVSNLSLSSLTNGDLDAALAEARRDRELGSPWGTGRFFEGLALYEMGRFDEAASVLRGVSAPWAGLGPQSALALALVASGRPDDAVEVLAAIENGGDPFAAGLVHVALGDSEAAGAAFEHVEWGRHWPTLSVRYFYSDVWGALKGGGRYKELIHEVDRAWGLVQGAPA